MRRITDMSNIRPIVDEAQYFERTGWLFPPGVTHESQLRPSFAWYRQKKILKTTVVVTAVVAGILVATTALVVLIVAGVGELE